METPLKFCSFCNAPGPKHEGGAEIFGEMISGDFCNESCFKKWLRWKGAIIAHKKAVP